MYAAPQASLSARIVARRPLHYGGGADAALDRPAHVRAASSLSWVGARLAIVQDDAHFVALVDPRSGEAEAVALPAGPDGKRVFDEVRGTKHLKLDLEASLSYRDASGTHLLAFGSGSLPARERIVALHFADGALQPDSVQVHCLPVRQLSLGKNAGAASGLQQSLGEIGKEHSLEARGSAELA